MYYSYHNLSSLFYCHLTPHLFSFFPFHSLFPSRANVCKALLQSSYATSLFTLTRAAVAAAREEEILSEESCVNISELVNGIDDAGKLNYKDTATTSAGGRVRGRVLIGEEAVPVLLEVLFLIK